jgi:hypothetical protein
MSLNMGYLGWKTRSQELKIEKIILDSIVIKLGQDACLGNCLNEFDGLSEWSKAILALLLAHQSQRLRVSY